MTADDGYFNMKYVDDVGTSRGAPGNAAAKLEVPWKTMINRDLLK